MSRKKREVEAAINLSPLTCYRMRTGKCSLDVVLSHYLPKAPKIDANDLLFCPRLYQSMRRRRRLNSIAATLFKCGHLEVIAGHQKACIAGRKGIALAVRPAADSGSDKCPVCESQLTFDNNSDTTSFVRLNIFYESCE
jgi:hypothetical protein